MKVLVYPRGASPDVLVKKCGVLHGKGQSNIAFDGPYREPSYCVRQNTTSTKRDVGIDRRKDDVR